MVFLSKLGAEALEMCIASDLDRSPLGQCCPDFWWGRRLLPGYQEVGLVFGAQDAGLVSGFQGVGLSSDGVESFCRDVGQNMVMKRRGRTGVILSKRGCVDGNLIAFQDAVLTSGGRGYFSQNSKLG